MTFGAVQSYNPSGRLAQWMLFRQEFDFQIRHTPGVQHAVADYLSCLESGEPSNSTYDDLPDANLFSRFGFPIELISDQGGHFL